MYATIIVALIAAISAILAPVITALIQQRSAYRLAAAEWFFKERASSYKELLSAADQCLKNPCTDNIQVLRRASDAALLFSTIDTQAAISAFGQLILSSDLRTSSSQQLKALSAARLNMMLAMQKELDVKQANS